MVRNNSSSHIEYESDQPNEGYFLINKVFTLCNVLNYSLEY